MIHILCCVNTIDRYYEEGFRQFHASNTLPTLYGGLSGPALIPYTKHTIRYLRKCYKDTVIIAGGGIYDIKTMEEYKNCGANHFSVSSIFFSPFFRALTKKHEKKFSMQNLPGLSIFSIKKIPFSQYLSIGDGPSKIVDAIQIKISHFHNFSRKTLP